jgi:hypothetical protein
LLKADKNNCRIAASLIGSFYLHGKYGVKKDVNETIYWHRKAFFENEDTLFFTPIVNINRILYFSRNIF